MTVVLATPPFITFQDDDGNPLSGGLIYTYAAGTTTPKATYTDSTGLVESANPIVLDAAGRAVWFIDGAYKYIIKDSLGNVIRTVDNVTSFTTLATAANAYFESFSGNGVQTVFVLSQDMGTEEKALMVFVDAGGTKGYDIQAPTAFTINGTSLTFAIAPASGTLNIYVFAPSLLLGAASAAAAAAQTSAASAATSAVQAAASAISAMAFSAAKNMWTFSATTSMANPGTGLLRFNNATVASVTAIAISDLSANTGNPDLSPWVLSWDDVTGPTVRGTLYIYNDDANFVFFNITGATTDNSGWSQLTVTFLNSAGTISDANSLFIGFAAAGSVNVTGGITALTGDVTASGSGSQTATIANNAVTNAKILNATIDLTTKVTGTLPVANGGTGSVSLTANSVMLGNGTSALSANLVAPSTSGNVLTSNGTTWASSTPVSGVVTATPTTFTGATSVAVTVDFTTYSAYQIIFTWTAAGAGAIPVISGSSNSGGGYTGAVSLVQNTNTGTVTQITGGSLMTGWAAQLATIILTVVQSSTSAGVNFSSIGAAPGSSISAYGAGSIALTAACDRIRLTGLSTSSVGFYTVVPIGKR